MKVHLLAEAGVPHARTAEMLDIGVRSVERIVKEAAPTAEEISADERLVGPGPRPAVEGREGRGERPRAPRGAPVLR